MSCIVQYLFFIELHGGILYDNNINGSVVLCIIYIIVSMTDESINKMNKMKFWISFEINIDVDSLLDLIFDIEQKLSLYRKWTEEWNDLVAYKGKAKEEKKKIREQPTNSNAFVKRLHDK